MFFFSLFLGPGKCCSDFDRGVSSVRERLQTGTCYLSHTDLLCPDTRTFTTRIVTIYLNQRRVHYLCSAPVSTSAHTVRTRTHVSVISQLRNTNRPFTLSSDFQLSVIWWRCNTVGWVSSCGATLSGHVTLALVMSEPCDGPGAGAGQGRDRRDVPRFVLGCEDDEQDAGQMEAGMKNEMYREEEMEDDEDESVSGRC